MASPNEILDACNEIRDEAPDQNGVMLPGVCRACTEKAIASALAAGFRAGMERAAEMVKAEWVGGDAIAEAIRAEAAKVTP